MLIDDVIDVCDERVDAATRALDGALQTANLVGRVLVVDLPLSEHLVGHVRLTRMVRAHLK